MIICCWVLLFSFDTLLILCGRFMSMCWYFHVVFRVLFFVFVTMLILFECQPFFLFVCACALLMSSVFHCIPGFCSLVCFLRFLSSHPFLVLLYSDTFSAVLLLFFFGFVFRCLVLLLFFRISFLLFFLFISICVVASALRVLPAETRLTVYRRHEV